MSLRTDVRICRGPLAVDAYPDPATVHTYRTDVRVVSRALLMVSQDRSPTVPQEDPSRRPPWQVSGWEEDKQFISYCKLNKKMVYCPGWEATSLLTWIVGDRASYSTYAPTLPLHDRTCSSYYRLRDTVCTGKLTYKVHSRSAEEPRYYRGVYGCGLQQRALSDPRPWLT